MSGQLGALLRKEWRLFLRIDSTRNSAVLRALLLVALGSVFGFSMGPDFGRSWATVAIIAFIAWLVVVPAAAESFAGEREAATLETLLLTPASDEMLLGGKFLAMTLYGAAIAAAVLAAGLVASYVLALVRDTTFAPRLDAVAFALVYAFVVAAVSAAAGILVSLRAPTVRAATQSLTLMVVAVVVLPALIAQLVPDAWKSALPSVEQLEVTPRVLLMGAGQLLVVSALLLGVSALRFRRSTLLTN